MLKVTNLSYSYGSIQTLNSVSMEMKTGKVTCILGRNGVGKTTLLKNIMGVLRSSSGSIRQDDVHITHLPPHVRASGLAREKTWLAVVLFLITGGLWGVVWQARQFRVLNAWLGRKESSFLKWYCLPLAIFCTVVVLVAREIDPGEAPFFFSMLSPAESVEAVIAAARTAPSPDDWWLALFELSPSWALLLLHSLPLIPLTFGVYHVCLHYRTARVVGEVQQEMDFPVSSRLPRKVLILGALEIVSLVLLILFVVFGLGGLVNPFLVLSGGGPVDPFLLLYLSLSLGLVSKILLQREINDLFDKMPIGQKDTVGLGYVPQGRQIFPRITVEQNLKVALQGRRDGGRVVPEYVYELFPVLKEMAGRMGGDLSGGQQQQLAIARALCGDPEILVLDEPTEGIQPNIIQQIGEVLRKLVTERGMTVVLVEQYLDFVKEFGQEFFVLNRGRVVANGTTEELSMDIVRKHLSV